MDPSAWREAPAERARVESLMAMLPRAVSGGTALDIGARDGYLSNKLAGHFSEVVALDLELPQVEHDRVRCVKGNITALDFPDRTFELVLCAEVLEHINPPQLTMACRELARVSRRHLLIGVPFRQDTRVGRTTCAHCGKANPPWGHVNSFDEGRLAKLFPECVVEQTSFVGVTRERTNWLASTMMDLAGNPYGSYSQEEGCIHCGSPVGSAAPRGLGQKILTKAALWTMHAHQALTPPHGNWIHQLLRRKDA